MGDHVGDADVLLESGNAILASLTADPGSARRAVRAVASQVKLTSRNALEHSMPRLRGWVGIARHPAMRRQAPRFRVCRQRRRTTDSHVLVPAAAPNPRRGGGPPRRCELGGGYRHEPRSATPGSNRRAQRGDVKNLPFPIAAGLRLPYMGRRRRSSPALRARPSRG